MKQIKLKIVGPLSGEYCQYIVKRKYFGLIWLEDYGFRLEEEAQYYIDNYCEITKRKNREKIERKLLKLYRKRIQTIECDCE